LIKIIFEKEKEFVKIRQFIWFLLYLLTFKYLGMNLLEGFVIFYY
jgi:hypothetical protein